MGETPKSEKRNRLSPLTSARVSMHYSYILSPSQSAVTDYIGLSVLSRVSLSEDEHSPIISDSDMSLEGVDAFSIQNEADMFLNPGYNKRLSAE